MKRLIFGLTLVLVFSFTSYGQSADSDCNCCTPEYRQFDFWVGNWTVTDSTGKILGSNLVHQIQDGCALQENWTSKGMTGTSYNFYNSTDQKWRQIWIDNKGGSLELKGKFEDGKMVLKSELLSGEKVDYYYNEIEWILNSDGTVTQTWNIKSKENKLLNTVFVGIYKKKS